MKKSKFGRLSAKKIAGRALAVQPTDGSPVSPDRRRLAQAMVASIGLPSWLAACGGGEGSANATGGAAGNSAAGAGVTTDASAPLPTTSISGDPAATGSAATSPDAAAVVPAPTPNRNDPGTLPPEPSPIQPPTLTEWVVGKNLTFIPAQYTTYNLVDTLPREVARGGVFSVHSSGAALPAGVTLTPAGLLSVLNSAPDGATAGVVFAYDLKPVPPPPPPPPPPAVAGNLLTSLKLSGAGNAGPYSATVLPLQGQVPQGWTLVSPDDGGLRAAVISRWSDGSAAVMVIAGYANAGVAERSVRLQLANNIAGETPLVPARIASAVNAVVLDAGVLGRAELRNFSSPERVWWATSQTICARYRQPLSGHGTLELVVDIHAYADGRALVETVVENCKLNTASPSRPAAASYSGATLSVNGSTVATVNAAGAPEGNHAPFRAWYAAAWVGGDPGWRATQAVADLQKHPLLFKVARNSTADLSIYANDSYAPWGAGRHRASGMGAGGDHPSIGPLPQWEARALQSGDPRAWRAVEASALAILGFGVNYRDAGTGAVPTLDQLQGASMNAGQRPWPNIAQGGAMGWEVAHHPAVGLMAFIGRPSPVFVELSQKVAVWNATWSAYLDGRSSETTGVFGRAYQVRGRAWCLRSLAHATFITPDSHPWRASALTSIAANVTYLDQWRNDPKFVLGAMCDESPQSPGDHETSLPGFHQSVWQHHYLVTEVHKVASAGLLVGSAQSKLQVLADWCAAQPVRFVNEQPNGGWRFIPYKDKLGDSATAIGSAATWGAERNRAGNHSDSPASVSGSWMSSGGAPSTYASYTVDGPAGAYYPSYFWAALVAARERNVPGAAEAWQAVQSNVANLQSWLDGFGRDPRWGAQARNT